MIYTPNFFGVVTKTGASVLLSAFACKMHANVHMFQSFYCVTVICEIMLPSDACFFAFFEIKTKTTKNENKIEICFRIFYKQPQFRFEPRVAIKFSKMRFKVAMKFFQNRGSRLLNV